MTELSSSSMEFAAGEGVLLYVPAPRQTALMPIERSSWARAKSWVRRRYEIESAIRTGVIKFSAYHHRFRHNTNRGDMAIAQAIRTQVCAHAPRASIREVGWDDVDQAQLTALLRDCTSLVIGGGGYIFLDPQGRLNPRQHDLRVFEKFSGKLVAHGIGLNRLTYTDPVNNFRALPEETRSWVKAFAQRCDSISVRDFETARLFSEVGGREVEMVGDPALSLGSDGGSRSKLLTGIVGINTASHGQFALKCLERVLPIMEQAFHHLQDGGASLKYFVHDDADYGVMEVLRRRGLRFEVVDGSVNTLVSAYRECDFVVNQMLHSSILAHSAGTSALAIAYDLKQSAYFALFDLAESCIPWSEVSVPVVLEAIDKLRCENLVAAERRNNRVMTLVNSQNDFLAESLGEKRWPARVGS